MNNKKPKIIVKIRKEQFYYLAYFIEIRRLIPVDYVGAQIIDAFFNQQRSVTETTHLIKERIGEKLDKSIVLNFLRDLKQEILTPYEGGYPVVGKELMDVPIAVELQINTTCNLRCKHCCQSSYDKIMPLDQIQYILKILNKKGVFEINLTGGELFLHPNILSVIQLCCEKYNFATLIITNGTLLTQSLIKKLVRFRRNLAFLISLEGVGEINDKIRGQGVFDKVDKTLRLLKKHGFHIEISSTINKLNIEHYQELIDYANKLKIPVNFNLFKLSKKGQEYLVLDPYQYFEFVEDIFRQKHLNKADVGLTNAAIASELLNHKKRKTCRATLSGLSIDVEGKMVPCPFLEEVGYYHNKKLPVFNEHFLDNWKNNYHFEKFRQGNLYECQACAYI